jgi:uncharacterized protein YbjQ (UPF0145 family)
MSKQCLKCGYVRKPTDQAPDYSCPKCQAVYAKVEAHIAHQRKERELVATARASGNWAGLDPSIMQKELAQIVLTTTEAVPGFTTTEVISLVSSDYAFAFGAISESIGGLARNIAGSGRSGQTVALLKEGRTEVLRDMRQQALDFNAHAIVGVRIDYEEISGANSKGILIVVATGTAVRLRRIEN